MAGKITMDKQQALTGETTDYMQVGTTTFEVVCRYQGNTSLMELLKSAIKRDTETALEEAGNLDN